MSNLMQEWISAKHAENKAKQMRVEVEAKLFTAHQHMIKRDASTTITDGDHKMKVVWSSKRVWDMDKVKEHPLFPTVFETTYKENKKHFNALTEESREELEDFLTEEPKKPTFKIEVCRD